MNKRSLRIFASILVISMLAACNGSVNLVMPNETPTQAAQNAPATTAPSASAPTTPAESGADVSADLFTLQNAYEQIYTKVVPSVVTITTSQAVTTTLPNNQKQAPQLQPFGAGSGFVWDKEGHIVTNNHVVDGADLIRVNLSNGNSVVATVIGSDSQSDLAVLKIDGPVAELTPIEVADSTQAKIGQIVIAIGNPFDLNNSMSTGIISGLDRSLSLGSTDTSGFSYTIPDLIQTDAAINPGNSGGVLVDIQGKLLGVTSAIESPVRANSGVGYVIPSVIVQKIVPILIKNGSYQQPWIGISGHTLTPSFASAMNLSPTQRGALVVSVTAGSPAEKAGLLGSTQTAQVDGQSVQVGGDVITAADGKPINSFEDMVAFLARYTNVGQTIKLTLLRSGKSIDVSLTLAARPTSAQPTTPNNQPQPTAGSAWLGIQGMDVTPEIATAMGIDPATTGALVEQVSPTSPAEKAGLVGSAKPFTLNGQQIKIGGDIITAINGSPIDGIQTLAATLAQFNPGDNISVTVLRGGKSVDLQVTLGQNPNG
jgi:serine protease Do